MSRSDVLVAADWVQEHAADDGVVLVEVDEDTSAYDKGHIKGAVKVDWKKDLQDPVRRDFVDREGCKKLLSARGIRLRLVQAQRPLQRQAAVRGPQEVGAGLPREGVRCPAPRVDQLPRA